MNLYIKLNTLAKRPLVRFGVPTSDVGESTKDISELVVSEPLVGEIKGPVTSKHTTICRIGVSDGLCEHVSTAFFFESTSIDKSQLCEPEQSVVKNLLH